MYAGREGLDYEALIEGLREIKQRLWRQREKRPAPLCDRKLITAWNGMAIRAFALAGRQLERPDYLACAIKAAEAILQHNKTVDGELSRASLGGRASVPALQEDYACLAEALLAIYDATLEPVWLQRAMETADNMITRFWDAEQGGFFMGRRAADALLPAAPKPLSDDATAAGNAVALRLLAQACEARRRGALYGLCQASAQSRGGTHLGTPPSLGLFNVRPAGMAIRRATRTTLVRRRAGLYRGPRGRDRGRRGRDAGLQGRAGLASESA